MTHSSIFDCRRRLAPERATMSFAAMLFVDTPAPDAEDGLFEFSSNSGERSFDCRSFIEPLTDPLPAMSVSALNEHLRTLQTLTPRLQSYKQTTQAIAYWTV
jgi:hypothetical protein